ncbi:MAG: hypothetical protein ACYC61_31410, partial [Isosphaeraceae bacterium]
MPVRTQTSTDPGEDEPAHRRLVLAGLVTRPLDGLVALLSDSVRYGEGHRDRPILSVLALLNLAWVCYAWALAAVLGRGGRRVGNTARVGPILGRRLPTVLTFAIAFRVILLFSRPIQEIDYYRYLWDGRVLLNGLNPFAYAPAEIDRLGLDSAPDSMPGRLWGIRSRSVPIRTIFERVHHREVPTIYPPASQLVFACAALLTPPQAPVEIHVLVLKALLLAFDLGTLVVLARLLRRLGLPEDWSLAYGWCPLVLKEFANTGHLDTIAVFFTTLAVDRLIAASDRISGRRSLRGLALGGIWLGVAVLAKGYPVVILPMIAGFLAARWRARALIPALALAAVVLAGYAPFRTGLLESGEGGRHSPWTGLGTFLVHWQKNDFLFMLVHENLRVPDPGAPDRWFVLVPREWRRTLDDCLASPLSRFVGAWDADPAFLVAQGVMGAIVAAIAIAWGVRVYRTPLSVLLLRGIGLVLAWSWLLCSTPHPWYLTWSLPFLVFAGRRSWFLLPALALIYYLRFSMEYQAAPGGLPAVENAFESFDYGVVWLEYVPFLAFLALETWRGGA